MIYEKFCEENVKNTVKNEKIVKILKKLLKK